MDRMQQEIEFARTYKKNPTQAVTLMYGKLLDVEQKVDETKRLMSILFSLIVVPIVGILVAAFFRLIIKV